MNLGEKSVVMKKKQFRFSEEKPAQELRTFLDCPTVASKIMQLITTLDV